MRVQQGEDGGNGTVGMEALRRVLLGYLNVSTLDCTLGECLTLRPFAAPREPSRMRA
jgi:hypothetical protein